MKPITSLAKKSNPNTVYTEQKQPITSLAKKSNPNTVYTEQKQNKLQQTKHRGVYQKKKKKSPIHKPKPNPSKPNPVTHDHNAAARSSSSSSLAPHRRSLCLCSGAPFGPPSRYFSLFFSYSLSLSH